MDKISEKRFNEMLNATTEAENNGLKTDDDGEEITLDKVESLLKGLGSGKIDKHEFKEKYNGIVCDAKKILKRQPFTTNEKNMIEIISLLREIYKPKDKKTDEQPDTTNMPELQSKESAQQIKNQEEKGLKILTPNQMLSRSPITLAQLNAGNNSEKLKNEIRQLLYSLYRSKKLTKQMYKSLINII